MKIKIAILVGLVSASGCGGKVARSEECLNVQGPCFPHDASSSEGTSTDEGGRRCSGVTCGADLDGGSEPDGNMVVDAAPPSFDPLSACLVDDDIFTIGGDDNLHLGPPLTLRGGAGWSITTTASSAGLPTHVTVYIQDNWAAEFSTEQLGTPLSPGTYVDAERAAFAEPNHPGLDVYGDGNGCNKVAGKFQILAIESSLQDGSSVPVVTSFAATFEQHCEAGKRANVGCVRVRL